MCLFKCLLDDLGCKTVDLKVHLNSCDTLVSTSYLEVHIAVEVFKTLDVEHCVEGAVFCCDKTAGDTCNGSFDRNTCVHKSKCRAADRTLGCRTVGGNYFRNKADSVGEFFNRGKNGNESAFSESAVADLTSAGAADSLCFTCGVSGHVVVVHISLFRFVVEAFKHLAVGKSAYCSDCENLCLTACEKTGAVYTGEKSNLGCEGTELVHASAVNTFLVNEEPTANDLLLDLVDKLGKDNVDVRIFFSECFSDSVLDGLHLSVAYSFVVCVESFHNVCFAESEDLVEHIVVKLARGVIEFGLADLCNDAVDELEKVFDLLVSLHDSVEHNVIGNFLSACFDHNNLLFACSNCELECAYLALFSCGVDNDLAVNKAYESATDRSVPRNIGDGEGDGCADHGCDFGGAVLVNGHNCKCKSYVVAKVLGEEGTNGSVDNAACKDRLFRRSAFAAEIASGDLAYCVHLFVVVNGKGKEVDTVAGLGACRSASEDRCFAVADHAGAVCESCNLAGLYCERSAGVSVIEHSVIFEHFCLQKL